MTGPLPIDRPTAADLPLPLYIRRNVAAVMAGGLLADYANRD